MRSNCGVWLCIEDRLAQRRRIGELAIAYVRRDDPYCRPEARAVRSDVIVEYAAAWLAEHHEMPTGIHQAQTVKPHPMGFRDLPTTTVD